VEGDRAPRGASGVTFEIEIAARTRTISVEALGPGRYRVVVDGRPRQLDAVRAGACGLSILLDAPAGSSREVLVAPAGTPGELLVGIDGRTITAAVNGNRSRRGADGAPQPDGEQHVLAPMPGRVVRVLVAEGDEVIARQAVVVVEAMKMENELRAPKAGRVKQVAVAPGTPVEAGRVLVVIE
jgi:biotin carboxyl carrier protein